MDSRIELVRLLDDDGTEIGTADKALVHTTETPLHLAFSCHLVDEEGRTLLTRRALSKLTWPGVWTNSFCGHPAPGESFEDAIVRRAALELNVSVADIRPALPDFRYRAVDASGVVENEICPVFTAMCTDTAALSPNADEVCDWAWADIVDVEEAVEATPFVFSPWLVAQIDDGVYTGGRLPGTPAG
ncbi:isopentenyl-diphosphate delta-isomerase [Arthrobacter sp. ERGS1:01]|uniref:isopentenyl-diphosphate Delta-isomerase n=1 Tax=Arthrobacter sp. ERGS1:01 TaxID=1704044 RepID=UPI0006B4F03A|nr:isopentenyl-diphosphate Delta-isomerase [Arthrobacter sp. ERGS1:01]ALE05013.1 isopentenyl-diphosphate delta-isomerase [Arthrobacter sp. ERGS1:01]